MKKLLLLLIALAASVAAWAWDGSGTQSAPYLIKTTDDLVTLSTNSASNSYNGTYFRLENDLDMAGVSIEPIGISRSFRGVFDGNGHVISNLTISKPDDNKVALFGQVTTGFSVKSLILDGAIIAGNYYVGALVGNFSFGCNIENCLVVNSHVTANGYAGIIMGSWDSNATLSSNYYRNCSVSKGDNTSTTNIGVGDDREGAVLSNASITMPAGVRVISGGVAYNGTVYTASGATVTFSSDEELPVGCSYTYTPDGGTVMACTVTGDGTFSFTMPAEGDVTVGIASVVATWATVSEIFANASTDADNPTKVVLDADITAGEEDTYITLSGGRHVILDLNGHTLDRHLSEAKTDGSGYVIRVNVRNTSLTIRDSGTGGTITGGWNKNGAGCIQVGGTLRLESGTITGNRVSQNGGAISLYGNFYMTGGAITGNAANLVGNNIIYCGGALYFTDSSHFYMSGGSITGNYCGSTNDGAAGIGCYGMGHSHVHLSGTYDISGNFEGSYEESTGTWSDLSPSDILNHDRITYDIDGAISPVAPARMILDYPYYQTTFTTGWATHMSGIDPETCFILANPDGQGIGLNADGEATIGTLHTITLGENITASATSAAPGRPITLGYTNLPDGYQVYYYTVTIDGSDPVETVAVTDGTFAMPDGDVTVAATLSLPIDEAHFPDANFRDWLLSQDYGSDGVLTDEEVADITSLNVTDKSISDLTGIEYFTALTFLSCGSNQLQALDVSHNTALTLLDCFDNQLTVLDVSHNTALTRLDCSGNQLTSLDVSRSTALAFLGCFDNQLQALDVSHNTALTVLYCYDNRIYGENMAALVASLPTVDVENNYSQNGDFYVINLDSDTEQNVITTTQVATARGKNWTVYGQVNGRWLAYDGSELPIEVTYIDENRNEQSALAVPLTGNETSLGVAGVERWYVASGTLNYTRTLTLRGDVHLILADGAVMNVGTEAEPIDEYGIVDSNTPASLTIFGQTLDDDTAGHLNVFSNDDCIYVSDDYAQHSGNVTLNSSNGSGLVSDNNITFTGGTLNATADKNAIANGGNVDILGGKLSAICVGSYWGINTIGNLTFGWKDADDEITVSGLVGSGGTARIVEGQAFTDGENIYDSTTPSEVFWALANVTLRPVLPTFAITLPGETPHGTVSSDKTEAAEGETVTLTVTPDEGYALGTLTVLNGDSPVETTAGENGTYTFEMPAAPVTVTAVFVLPIDSINFPDANFRDWLLSQSYGSDRLLTDEEIAGITSIPVNNKSISDLTGIERFSALKYLYCNFNQLTALNVSQNTALTSLECNSNRLTALDVSQNTALTSFRCVSNQLTSLDVSNNTELTHLYCDGNQLTALDVSHNTALTWLWCNNNQLTALDVSHNTALTDLRCYMNQLTSLDVSHNTALTQLYCYENKINGENMAALVASMPTVDVASNWGENGDFRVIDLDSETEQNVITTTQVTTARGKNWNVYGRTNGNWTAYDGSEPTTVPGDLNSDGAVDVTDVNILINLVLENITTAEVMGNPDLDGNNTIDIGDVNAIINIILTN